MSEADRDPVLRLDGIEAGYGAFTVLHGVDMAVHAGETVVLIGANGAGKSTVLRVVGGFLAPTKGSVRLSGDDVTKLRPHQMLARGCAYVAQGQDLFPEMTVMKNVEMGGYLLRDRALLRERLAFCTELFPMLGEKANIKAGGLSGGERQQLKIARALVTRPHLLLLDEPTAGLSPLLVDQIFDDLATIREQTDIAILLVEQNVAKGLEYADRACIIDLGAITVDTEAEQLLHNSLLHDLYLGGEQGSAAQLPLPEQPPERG
ncbi:MAG: ATP-binding cassette domain-containing protein [Streptosporangiales bacterium]|nr:ATP-binding cassette domain-containing protein [Streptosporangiales bacterium]